MERKSSYTIRTLLYELRENFPEFKEKQIFETLKSIYPTTTTEKNKKNIVYNGRTLTKPLALNRKDKGVLVKEHSDLAEFFKDFSRGDILEVVETDGETAKCRNITLKESVKKKFYTNEEDFVTIKFEDLANGTVKSLKKNISKYLNSIQKKEK